MFLIDNRFNNTVFTGKPTLLKDADWICRKAKTTFPAISPNRLFYENCELIQENERFKDFIHRKGKTLIQDRNVRKFLESPFQILKAIIYSMKEHKVAHCSEYSTIAELIARMNGIKNCYQFFMKDYDHTFLLITKTPLNDGIKINDIIIDPWLGISGRLRDVLMQYQHQYSDIFDIDDDNIVLHLKKSFYLEPDEINYFKEKFPELIFKSRDGRKFMDFSQK